MLRLLRDEPRSVTAVATRLGIAPNRAHYHLQQLVAQDLVREVGTGARRWGSEERYYAAAARHFVIDPGLGAMDPEVAAALARAADMIFLDWHRREVAAVDFAQIAARAMNTCLRVRRGERVLVIFSPFGLELAEAMIVEAEAAGAEVRVRTWSRNLILRTVDRHTAGELAAMPYLPPHVDDDLDAVIFVHSLMSQGAPPNPEQMAKVGHHLQAMSVWNKALRSRGVRFLMITVPYRAEMSLAEAGPDAAAAAYWRATLADSADLQDRGRRIQTFAAGGGALRLRCPRGTDLTVPIAPALTQVGDGVVSEDDAAAGAVFEQLPGGMVSFLPGAEPAQGTFVGEYAFVSGVHCRGVRVGIVDGVMQEITAETGGEELHRRLAANIGPTGAVGSVAIGINPVVQGLTGKHGLDVCGAGHVTLLLGNNEMLGGSVASTFTLVLPARGVTASVDGVDLVREGELA